MALEGILHRHGGSAPVARAEVQRGMSVLEHLRDLRRVLIIVTAAWAPATVVGFFFWPHVLQLLVHQGGISSAFYPTPTGAFALALKISIYLGFILASPVIFQQVWWFVSPALHRHERRLALPLLLASIVFFGIGVGFALAMLPVFIRVLSGFAPDNLHYLPLVDEYVSFVLVLIIGFGLLFELPVVLYTLGRLRIISSSWLYSHRLYWMVGLGLLAALGTPGADPITPLFLFVPLYVFWEGTALLLRLTGR
ncbi:MAG TPA: twin-arginine translocase subunit TatC [Candidatus Dormibacteraeota bacterium]|jgi:sec-independent protein translocase protein TatC